MNNYTYENLQSHMRAGHVYRRDMLLPFSSAVDRDLNVLVKRGELKKLSSGIYYKPAVSPFGVLPPDDKELISCFLRDDQFLLYSMNQYNSLGLGLTQLYNRVVVLRPRTTEAATRCHFKFSAIVSSSDNQNTRQTTTELRWWFYV